MTLTIFLCNFIECVFNLNEVDEPYPNDDAAIDRYLECHAEDFVHPEAVMRKQGDVVWTKEKNRHATKVDIEPECLQSLFESEF